MADVLGAWVPALPAALVAVAWLLVPGLAVTSAGGLRGVLAWALAPGVSVAMIATGAVVASAVGVPWSAPVAAVPALAVALVVWATRLLLSRRRTVRPAEPDGRPVALALLAGAVLAAVVGAFTVVDGMTLPTAVSQTYDAVFHYNAVAHIVADRDASSLTLGTVTTPGAVLAFYPAAWHDVVSLVVLSAGASIPLASNVVAAVMAVVVWPLGCTALVRVVVGPSWPALAATPVVALGFLAFPWSLLDFGVLWPNLVGVSLLPAALAVVVAAIRTRPSGSLTRVRAVLLVPVLVVGLGLGHPSAVFGLVVLAAFPITGAFVGLLIRMFRTGWRGQAVLAGAVALAAVLAGVAVLLGSPLFADVRSFDWPAFATPLEASREVALGATNRRAPEWVLAVVVLIGAVASWGAGRRWLVPAHVAVGALYVLAASSESALAAALTAFWYNDSYRLAAMLPVTAVPLAVLGLLAVGSLLHRLRPLHRAGPGALTTVVAAVVLVVTGGGYARPHAAIVDDSYLAVPPGRSAMLDPAERAFFAQVAALVPPGSVVAQNPWTGSALLWALTGREVLFPHLVGAWTADQQTLARSLDDASDDPAVCAAAERSDVDHLLVGVADFWPGDPRSADYPGLEPPDPGRGFRLLAADGSGNALYQLTACGAEGAAPTG